MADVSAEDLDRQIDSSLKRARELRQIIRRQRAHGIPSTLSRALLRDVEAKLATLRSRRQRFIGE